MSFATLDEAWGGVGHLKEAKSQESRGDPQPSDVEYGRRGAPIMDDIVTLYTADEPTVTRDPSEVKDASVHISARQHSRELIDAQALQASQAAKHVLPSELDHSIDPPKRRKRESDDYNDIDTPFIPRRSDDQSNSVIELAAYVLSGIILIFVFESFIHLGSNLRVRGY